MLLTTPALANPQPFGAQMLCHKHPTICQSGGANQIALSKTNMAKLRKVNRKVNRQIKPRNDHGDVWSMNVRFGDCEDYALTKRGKLIGAGLPASALRIATAITRQGDEHAVLVVRTDQGDLVLDNLINRIKPMNETGLRFIAMSGASLKKWSAF